MASNKEQGMTIGATSIEEQLARMSEAIARLTKKAEEKNLQVTALINRLEAQHDVKEEPSSLPTKRTEEGFDPNAYKLMSKAGYDFASSSNLGKKVANIVNNKERDLTQAQKKLKEHGYGVDNNKAGLGFTPNTPVKISSKAKNASVQHISVSIKQNQEEPKPAPRTSVFDRMNRSKPRISAFHRIGGQGRTSVFKRLNMPTPQSSVFERLSKPKKQSSTASSPPRRSALDRLEETKKPSRMRKTTPKEEKLNNLAEKDYVRSSIPSRMKRQAILEVDTIGPLKVKRRTIIHTGQSSCQQAQEDGTGEEVQDVFTITIQEDKENETPKKDVTFGSFNSKSSPQPLGACSRTMPVKSSEVGGWTHVTPEKQHREHTSHLQVHPSERGQSNSRQPPKLHESNEDDEITTRRSSVAITMRDFFPEDFFNHTVKTPCYEDCEECISKIV